MMDPRKDLDTNFIKQNRSIFQKMQDLVGLLKLMLWSTNGNNLSFGDNENSESAKLEK